MIFKGHLLHTVASLCLIVGIFNLLACQQIKAVPGELSSQVPNPVSDVLEDDRYVLGLRWYTQGEYDIARKFWGQLAEEGDCDGQYGLGVLYFEGKGVRQSYGKAVSWWKKAANQGQPQAQLALGLVYSHSAIPYAFLNCKIGCGEKKDLTEAFKWFSLASKSGSSNEGEFAGKYLEEIRSNMTPEQIDKGEALVETWSPEPSLCDPREVRSIRLIKPSIAHRFVFWKRPFSY